MIVLFIKITRKQIFWFPAIQRAYFFEGAGVAGIELFSLSSVS